MTRALTIAVVSLLAVDLARGDAPSFEDLVSSLGSPSAKTREESAVALGKSKRREAVGPLSQALRDPERKVRVQSVRALRALGDVQAAPALAGAVGDAEVEVRREAIAALVEVYAGSGPGPVDRFLDVFSDSQIPPSIGPGAKVAPEVEAALGRAVRDEDEDVRRTATQALGLLYARGSVRDLTGALLDPSAGVRKAAVVSVAQVGTAADGKALVPLLADESSEVRALAVQAVAHLRVKEAGPVLREAYEANPRRESGLKALAALSRIGDRAQTDLFQALVQDPDPTRKRLAVEGLARISDTSRLSGFKKDYQRERNEEVRLAYAFALVRLGDRDFVDTLVLSLPSRTVGRRSREYLAELGRDILPDLYPYLTDPDVEVRGSLCDIIGAAGDPAAIPRLTPLLNDPSAAVADRAHLAVERLKRLDSGAGAR
jgi:HEAT repeat protein